MDLKNILQIYTDCSIYYSDFGFGILFIDGEDEIRYQYRTTLNHIYAEYNMRDKCSTDFAETYAIIKAIENIHKKYDKIIIYMDNETSYKHLNKLK
jgi:ribonuclease HI